MNGHQLRAGVAAIDITPADLTGLNPFGPSFDAVHDPIWMRVLVLDDGDRRAAIISLDLVEVGDTSDIRGRIEEHTGISRDHILIAPSHDHNAPRIGRIPPGGKARIPTPESLRYTDVVYDAMVDTVGRAVETLEPARIGIAQDTVDVNVSREVYVDGKWTLGYNPAGASDKTLVAIAIQAVTGRTLAIMLNYAVHSTVALGVPELSGDLAGSAAAFVERELVGATALWLSGALGDQAPRVSLDNPTGNAGRDQEFAFAAVNAQGMLVGATALRAVASIERWSGDVRIDGALRVVACPVRRLDVPPGMEQADVPTVDLTLTTLTIGPIALAGVSGEVTVPVWRELAAASPYAHTILVTNANARIGYLPTDESYLRSTQAAEGCPIVQGYAQSTIVNGLSDMLTDSWRAAATVAQP